jgi:hypothetical protein
MNLEHGRETTLDRHRDPARKTASRPPVLLAMGPNCWSFSALIRAYVFAQYFDAPLLVLRAFSPARGAGVVSERA